MKSECYPLETPILVTDQSWAEDTIPLVSVSTLTYNHEPYIREAIESFLMQKTTFPIQIVIFDDVSTDGTREIVKEYESKYPNLIKGVYPEINTYGKPERNEALKPYFEARAISKYIALCEGDDYWTDPLKLQKQVDFMEENEDYSLIAHQAQVISGVTNLPINLHTKDVVSRGYKFEDILINGGATFATNSMLFRAHLILKMPLYFKNASVGDYPLMLHLALSGKIHFLEDIMSVYRSGVVGSWSDRMRRNPKQLAESSKKHALMLEEVNKETKYKYDNVVKDVITKHEFDYHMLMGNYRVIKETKEYKGLYDNYINSLNKKNRISHLLRRHVPFLFAYLQKMKIFIFE